MLNDICAGFIYSKLGVIYLPLAKPRLPTDIRDIIPYITKIIFVSMKLKMKFFLFVQTLFLQLIILPRVNHFNPVLGLFNILFYTFIFRIYLQNLIPNFYCRSVFPLSKVFHTSDIQFPYLIFLFF